MKKVDERLEVLMRIVVIFVSGLILSVWKFLIQILFVVNFLVTLVTGKRNRELAELCEIWNTQVYVFLRYITFVNNERPFPFVKLKKPLSKFGKR